MKPLKLIVLFLFTLGIGLAFSPMADGIDCFGADNCFYCECEGQSCGGGGACTCHLKEAHEGPGPYTRDYIPACHDFIDNDADARPAPGGGVDCEDFDCNCDTECNPTGEGCRLPLLFIDHETECGDCVSNESPPGGDGWDMLIDCFDPDCDSDPLCGDEICDDGIDNDADGSTDMDDTDCVLPPEEQVVVNAEDIVEMSIELPARPKRGKQKGKVTQMVTDARDLIYEWADEAEDLPQEGARTLYGRISSWLVRPAFAQSGKDPLLSKAIGKYLTACGIAKIDCKEEELIMSNPAPGGKQCIYQSGCDEFAEMIRDQIALINSLM